jgi:hypothetical protein
MLRSKRNRGLRAFLIVTAIAAFSLASEDGSHRYLILSDAQKSRTLEAMVMLVSQPPRQR